MSATRPTIIEFVEKYTHEYSTHVFLREKVDEKWTETSFEQTRKEGYRIAAGLMAMGLNKRYDDWISKYDGHLLVIDVDNIKFENRPEDFQTVTDKIDAELFGLFPEVRQIDE